MTRKRFTSPGRPRSGLLAAAAWVAALAFSAGAHAQGGREPFTREYFVRQEADEAVLIRINPFEAEFESRVYGPERVPLVRSALPGTRVAPLFQFINAVGNGRQLDIEVISGAYTERARFDLELTRLQAHDERGATLVRAYQLLSFALQAESNPAATDWPVKIGSALSAADVFGGFGMEELRLWATYIAANLAHHGTHDSNSVLGFTDRILDSARLARFPDVHLATLVLESAALIELGADDEAVQASLDRAAALAGRLDRGFERAWALARSAENFAGRGLYAQALTRFGEARDLADALGERELATEVRERLVEIHDREGDVAASGAVLQEIESQLAESGDGEELARNLLQQGRLHLGQHRYPEAIRTLSQALEHERNTLTRSRINLELGLARYESGDLEAARAILEDVLVDPGTGAVRDPNPLLDTAAGLGALADLYRRAGEHALMRAARDAQSLQPGPGERASRAYARGVDALAAGDEPGAGVRFREVRERAGPVSPWAALATLRLCRLRAAGEACNGQSARAAYRAVRQIGSPRQAGEGAWLLAGYLRATGEPAAALGTLDELVAELHFYRSVLPGVLGAWYWLNGEDVFRAWMSWSAADGAPADSLLALSRMRAVRAASAPEPAASDALRRELARFGASGDQAARAAFMAGLEPLRQEHERASAHLSREGLERFLGSLRDREAVLTWHLDPGGAYAWLAGPGGVRMGRLSGPGETLAAVEAVRTGLGVLEGSGFDRAMDRAGSALLAGLEPGLPETLYVVPPAQMLGLPTDALRISGNYLAERHRVAHLMAFPGVANGARRPRADASAAVFLAGHPTRFTTEYAKAAETSAEVRAVADRFVGPRLHIVQGGALLPDEFADPRLDSAYLVHLAMPGDIALGDADRSWLRLSEEHRGAGPTRLEAPAVRGLSLQAGMVFLGGTAVSGVPAPDGPARLGLVQDFLEAGAGSVVAGLWAVEDAVAARQAGSFYRRLQEDGDPCVALSALKRSAMDEARGTGIRDWARLQLYLEEARCGL